MNADQVIEGIGKAVATIQPAQEYCFLWINHWSTCMTKSEWSGWMQAVGVVLTIASALWVMNKQLKLERKRLRDGAAALINTFGGSLNAVELKLPANGNRSQWDIRMMRVLLESELMRSNEIPLHVLNTNEQQGVFAFRLSAFQVLEALRIVEPQLDPEAKVAVITQVAYDYLQTIITTGKIGISNGKRLLGEFTPNKKIPFHISFINSSKWLFAWIGVGRRSLGAGGAGAGSQRGG